MTELWFKRSCGLSQDPDMQTVMLAHGAVSIVVFEEIMAISKIRRSAGSIDAPYGLLGQRLIMKTRDLLPIVAALHDVGLLELKKKTGASLVADIPAWAKWNPKDPTATERQRRRRHGTVTANTVTVTAQEEEREKEVREPPLPPEGNRARDRVRYEDEMADYSAWLLPDAPEPDRTQLVNAACSWMRSRTSIQGPISTSHVLLWLRQHAPEHVPEENAA